MDACLNRIHVLNENNPCFISTTHTALDLAVSTMSISIRHSLSCDARNVKCVPLPIRAESLHLSASIGSGGCGGGSGQSGGSNGEQQRT